MAQFYTLELGGVPGVSGSAGTVDGVPVIKASATLGMHARLRLARGNYRMVAPAVTTADTINVLILPAGALFTIGNLCAGVSLGTATLALGTSTTPGKYRVGAVFTAVDTPTPFGTAAAMGSQTPLPADERVIATIGAAALPATGQDLVVMMAYSNG